MRECGEVLCPAPVVLAVDVGAKGSARRQESGLSVEAHRRKGKKAAD